MPEVVAAEVGTNAVPPNKNAAVMGELLVRGPFREPLAVEPVNVQERLQLLLAINEFRDRPPFLAEQEALVFRIAMVRKIPSSRSGEGEENRQQIKEAAPAEKVHGPEIRLRGGPPQEFSRNAG